MKDEFEEMEMPTPCTHCGKLFDLNDGYASEKWHLNITICETCHEEEEREIEEDDRWDSINIEITNALYELKEELDVSRLDEDNKKTILLIAQKLSYK